MLCLALIPLSLKNCIFFMRSIVVLFLFGFRKVRQNFLGQEHRMETLRVRRRRCGHRVCVSFLSTFTYGCSSNSLFFPVRNRRGMVIVRGVGKILNEGSGTMS